MMQHEQVQDGRADFDFLFGTWKIHNRRLVERLKGSTTWEEFEAIASARPVLGGLGNVDEVTMDRKSGPMHGMTVRTFNPATQEWSIYWADSVNGFTLPPMVGKFKNGRGEFYAHETHEGQHIFSRFIWSVLTEDTCRWEQAFSADGGRTWETNWTMEFERQA